MFYSQQAIQTLIDRIGWAAPIPPTTLSVSDENLTANSGRTFDEFYKMVIVENVAGMMQNANANEEAFNDKLYDLKKQAVMGVLSPVFDYNDRAYFRKDVYRRRIDISNIDYSAVIISRPALFDEAIGLSMAVKALELFLSSSRMNADERSSKFNYQTLKSELEGIKSDYGKDMTTGLYTKLTRAVKKIIDILFPEQVTPALIGRRPW